MIITFKEIEAIENVYKEPKNYILCKRIDGKFQNRRICSTIISRSIKYILLWIQHRLDVESVSDNRSGVKVKNEPCSDSHGKCRADVEAIRMLSTG